MFTDTQVGQRYGLPLLSPVNDAGKFTDEAGPDFAGLEVRRHKRAIGWLLLLPIGPLVAAVGWLQDDAL
jgi:isoleucyl-tRNA synthetase